MSPLIPPNRITVFPLKDDLQWYDPDVIFKPFDDIFGRGVIGATDLQVVANGTPDGQISVSAGRGYVPYSGGGKRYFQTSVPIRSDAAEFLNAIPAWPGSGNPKVHRVIARIRDATITPADQLKGGVFDVLAGTATSGANLTNLSGAQSVPADSLLLGNVLQNGSTISTGGIDSAFGTVRARARIGAGASPTKGFQVNGASLTDRGWLNFIPGTEIGIVAVDNPGNDSADLTITNAMTGVPRVIYDSGPLASSTVAVNIASIPGTFMALKIFWVIRSTDTVNPTRGVSVVFNDDVASNYHLTSGYYINGTAFTQSTTAGGNASMEVGRCPTDNIANAGIIGAGVVQIPDYANTNFYKDVIADSYWSVDGSGTGQNRGIAGGRWVSTNAITKVTFGVGAGNIKAGSRIYVVAF